MHIIYTVLPLVSYFHARLLFSVISLETLAVSSTADSGNLSETGQQKALRETSEFWA